MSTLPREYETANLCGFMTMKGSISEESAVKKIPQARHTTNAMSLFL
eukprot:CAMPEP_0206255664 /NCGR_PEP_ID=MMETSP0047_2-20121206/24363_1 /ASSEMBLY_ACC=CAM_ASM_000192 /TAXON_ID=195065 /ORGANISM="Chroomonas mesostigmatica_cf, Strain CCMP1168" /LENGTH=46 /DNA_ID= /DNA_START= /DNA_END= /DNA_ORIENTATION=